MAKTVAFDRVYAQQDQTAAPDAITTPVLNHTVAVGYLVAVTTIRTGGVDPVTPTLSGWNQNWAQISDVNWSPTTGARRRTTLFWVLADSSGAGNLVASWAQPPTMASIHVLAASNASGVIVQTVSAPFTQSSGLNEPITLAPLSAPGNRVAALGAVNVDVTDTIQPETIAVGGDADWSEGYVLGASSTPTNTTISIWLDVEAGSDTPGWYQTTQTAGIAYMVAVEIEGAPDDPPPGDLPGCEIGNSGYRLVIEAFYNPDRGIRRFGSGTFGSEIFGSAGGSGVERWVDLTEKCSDAVITRGQFRAATSVPTDTLIFELLDPAAEIVDWLPPGALASPQIGTPVRLTILSPVPGTLAVPEVFTGTIDRMTEQHDNVARQITIEVLGTRAQLATPLILPDRPRENAQQRIAAVLAEIGWTYGVEYPADLASYGLEQDNEIRIGTDALAITIITEAANSAGYGIYTDREGVLKFFALALKEIGTPEITIGDCYAPGIDSIANEIGYGADAQTILNVVQLVNRYFPNRSAEAVDPISVAAYGRRADGYGFPLLVANDDQFDAQSVAETILAQTANLIARCESCTFDTLTDPAWYTTLGQIEIGSLIDVQRTKPSPLLFNTSLIGYDARISPSGISGTLYLNSLNPTL